MRNFPLALLLTLAASPALAAGDDPWFRDYERQCRVGDDMADKCRGSLLGAYKEQSGADSVSCDFKAFWRARDERREDKFLPVLPWQNGLISVLGDGTGICQKQ